MQESMIRVAWYKAHCLPLDGHLLLIEYSTSKLHGTTTFADMQSILSLLLLFLANTTTGYLTPDPPGKYNVTLTTGPLIDYARNGRALMLSVFQPSTCASTVPVR